MSYLLDQMGKTIKYYRELRGYSQEKLAELIDVATKTVSLWETGKSFIEYPTLVKLCKVLEVEEVELFNFPTKKGGTDYDKIVEYSAKLSPAKQKQVLKIIETFI